MNAKPPSYVLDSFALLSHLQDESGSGRVLDLLKQAQMGDCRLSLSLINLGEICCLIERRRGIRAVHLTLASIENMPVEILPADRDAVLAAAHLKANYPISYADAFAAAAALSCPAILLTADPEFERLANTIQIEWLPIS
jgi:predicted nucleic acid-binding protein